MPLDSKSRPFPLKRAAIGALFFAGNTLMGLAPAQAQTFSTPVQAPFTTNAGSFSTTTSSASPVFDRPAITRAGVTSKPTGKSGLGNAVAYAATTFTPTATGTYTVKDSLTSYGNDGIASDYVQSLYTPTFSITATDPASLNTIVQSYNPPATKGGSYNVSLKANTPYVFVDHGYYNKTDPAVGSHGISFGGATTTLLFNDPGTTHYILNAAVISGSAESLVPQKVTETLNVTNSVVIKSFTGITIIGLQHGYVGDLTATLTHNGVTVVLFDHTDASNAVFQGDPGSGAIFSSSNTYVFGPTGNDLSDVAFGNIVPSGTYQATSNADGGFDTAHTGNSLNSFVNQNASGVWTLSVTNYQAGNSGSFLGFSFGINGSPAKAGR